MNRHWTSRLGDHCDFINGGTPSKAVQAFWSGDIPWITSADIADGSVLAARSMVTEEALKGSATNLVPPGTILLVARTGVGKVAQAPTALAFSQDITAIVPRAGSIDGRYLLRFLETRRPEFERNARGATIKGITRELIASQPILLPPLDEQRRIAAILDKADALRQKRKRTIALLDSLTQSIFLEMFGHKIEDAQVRHIQLGDMIAAGDRLNYGVVQPGEHVDGGVPIVRVSDLRNGSVSHSELKLIAPSIHAEYKRSILAGDEILVSCVGSIGEVVLASPDEKGFNIARAVARIPLSPEYSRVYVAEFLRTAHVQRYFSKESRTVSQPTLNIKQLSETLVPIPNGDEAIEFERRASTIRDMRKALGTAQAHEELLFASLQHRAFSGQL